MGKPAAQKQKEYRQRLKEKDLESYLQKDKERKRKKRAAIRNNPNDYENYKAQDRRRKRLSKTSSPGTSSPASNSSFASNQSLGKAKAKTLKSLPKSPGKKRQVLSRIISSLSPVSKKHVFTSARKKLSLNAGRPSISDDTKETIKAFLERPDISYCKPGRNDTVYCGKNNEGIKEYKSKHYLLWTIREILDLFHKEHVNTTYYAIHQVIANEKHICKVGDAADDDCRCEKCENVELLLTAIKQSLKMENIILGESISTDPNDFISGLVCSIKNVDCCNDMCVNCPGENKIGAILDALEQIDEITYAKWVRKGSLYKKIQITDQGINICESLRFIISKNFKIHIYNIYRQYSELKYLKSNLEENEVILSVDFSRNYENKQKHEIYHFTIFTAACYYKSDDTLDCSEIDKDCNLKVLPVVIVSNETLHERNIAFSCNTKLLGIIGSFLPNLQKVYFWSDGCTGQFRSKYVFRSLSYYPTELQLHWNYGEAHHFKGSHDGIGGTIKRKVYQHVSSERVVIQNAKHFATYADQVCNISVHYIDKSNIIINDLADAVYIPGTLQIHHVNRISQSCIEFYYNSPYKKESTKVSTIKYTSDQSNHSMYDNSVSGISSINDTTTDTAPKNIASIGDVVIVRYNIKKKTLTYLGVIQDINSEQHTIQFLKRSGEKTFSIKEGDIDSVNLESIIRVIPEEEFAMNNRGQYIIDKPSMLSNLDM